MSTQTIPEFLGVNTQCFLGKNERKKRKGKCLSPRRLPFMLLNFSIFCLFFDSCLGRSKKSFVNGRCVKLLETYVKHFHIFL